MRRRVPNPNPPKPNGVPRDGALLEDAELEQVSGGAAAPHTQGLDAPHQEFTSGDSMQATGVSTHPDFAWLPHANDARQRQRR